MQGDLILNTDYQDHTQKSLVIYSDGGARGNPGPAGAGAIVMESETGQTLAEISAFLGNTTNNQAEYQALIAALREALKYQPRQLTCYLDSELLVEQLSGRYKVKNPGLKARYLEVIDLIVGYSVRFVHIPREKNQKADALANQAMDRGK